LQSLDFSPANRERIAAFVRHHRIVLVVYQSASGAEIDVGFLNRLGVRTITTEDDSFDHTRTQSIGLAAAKFVLRRLLKRQLHDLHIANTQGQYDFLVRFAHVPANRVPLIRYGIDTERYCPGDRRVACMRLGLDPEVLWIMAAAQARPEKRVDRLIDVVVRVKHARPQTPFGFFYVGDGPMLEEWRQVARCLPSSADYRFFGKQRDLRPFYQSASIFVHGAVRESFGLVLAEAMASGLPVVGSRAQGPLEIVQDGSTGYLIGSDDWAAFADALLAYVDQPDLSQRHGEAGRRRCLDCYTSDYYARETAALIRPFLTRTASHRRSAWGSNDDWSDIPRR
jgi:glycosyltransferase involved in cell wall biosynthesis